MGADDKLAATFGWQWQWQPQLSDDWVGVPANLAAGLVARGHRVRKRLVGEWVEVKEES